MGKEIAIGTGCIPCQLQCLSVIGCPLSRGVVVKSGPGGIEQRLNIEVEQRLDKAKADAIELKLLDF